MTTEAYRQAISQMTPAEAEQEIAEQEEYERIERSCILRIPDNAEQTGLLLVGALAKEEFMRFTCSCGSTVSYGMNKIPETDTPMPCGHPKHFAVRFLL
jgi:hypothetical protein